MTHPGIDPASGTGSLAFNIARTYLEIRKLFRAIIQEHGFDLTPDQWVALNRLSLQEGMCHSDLADLTSKDRPGITRILGSMESQGLIVRDRDNSDRRRHQIFLTPQGKQLRDEVYPVVLDFLKRLTDGLEDEEMQVLLTGLDKMRRNLEVNFSIPENTEETSDDTSAED